MKGSLQNEVAIEFVPWLERAKRKFAGATIHNSGQFAVCVMDHKNVHLFDDFFAAMTFMEGHAEYRLHDLAEEPVQKVTGFANIKSQSDYEDRLYERRQERERQRQA
jgi:hypothetical protein